MFLEYRLRLVKPRWWSPFKAPTSPDTYLPRSGCKLIGKSLVILVDEFYSALKRVTVAQSELIPDRVKAALYHPDSAQIPAPNIYTLQ
ncbi:hypothetical protein SLE2022_359100 [Rubroshorea leprosula]